MPAAFIRPAFDWVAARRSKLPGRSVSGDTNTGTFAAGMDDFLGVPIENAYHVPGISTPPGTGIFANEKHGRLILTHCWKDGSMTDEERKVFMDQLLTDLGAVP